MHPYATDSLSGLSVDSSAFRQRAPRVQLSDDPDTATQQTVAEMCRQIHQAAKDPLVQGAAFNAVRMFRGGPAWNGGPPEQKQAESCWWWAKHYLRFKHHGSMFEAWSSDLGDPRTKLQLLIAPDVLVRMSRMEGDCAIYTMMLAAMLESLGLKWEIITAAVDRGQPEIFSHVWPRVVLPVGSEPLDASHGKYPGWQVPAEDVHRMWVFNQNGSRILEQGARFNGLHVYRRRPGMGRRGMGAMVCDETGACIDDGTSVDTSAASPSSTSTTTLDYTNGFPVAANQYQTSTGASYTGTAYVAPASNNSAQWASFATQLMKSGMTLAEINAIQPGTVVSANGAILRQNPGYAVGSTTTGTLNLGTGLSSSSMLLIGAAALVAILFMGKR